HLPRSRGCAYEPAADRGRRHRLQGQRASGPTGRHAGDVASASNGWGTAVRPKKALRAASFVAAAVTGCAGLLQWWWAGWSDYAGAGPPMGTRWLLTGAVGAAVLLPPCAAMCGASAARGLTDSRLPDEL